jgi:uncharacterized protein DUF3999
MIPWGRFLLNLACLAAMLESGAFPNALAQDNLARFEFIRSIQGPSDGEGIWRVPLDAQVQNAARRDFADLRVVSDDGAEVACVVRLDAGSEQVTPLTPAVYNREFVPGKSSSLVLDFGGRAMKNSLRISTPGKNFRREVQVEASEDGKQWRVIREQAFLFQAEAGAGGRPFSKDEVDLPVGDQRYLRVWVLNQGSDPRRVEIESISAAMIQRSPPTLEPVEISVLSTREDPQSKSTELILDTGARGRVLELLHFSFNDANFQRAVNVEGRDAEVEEVDLPLEDGGARRVRREIPWQWIASGTLRRVSAGEVTESGEAIKMGRAGFRFLRIKIYNGDDPPLKLREVQGEAVVRSLLFPAVSGRHYRLYYGNPRAKQPKYDLAQLLPRLEQVRVSAASLGAEEKNPAFGTGVAAGPGRVTRRLLLGGALALVLSVLVWLIRSVRRVPAN